MKMLFLISLCLIAGFLLMGCNKSKTSDSKPADENQASTVQDGQKLLNERCTVCHNLDRVKAFQKTADKASWEKEIDEMIKKGAKLNDTEKGTLMEYLLANPLE